MKTNQCQMILEYLKEHDGITQREAWDLGIGRLASRISDLRKRGHEISGKMITVTKANGEKTQVSKYSLIGE